MDISEDFPLRGFVTCASCGYPMTACWSRGRKARYPYSFCDRKGCADHRKSVRREKIEDEFEIILKSLRPLPSLFYLALDLMHEPWGGAGKSWMRLQP
ncbi:MAG: hypothetical protein HC850_01600 [Rhodomicrobium sp.]|nr:hypothetical protein [Rhodomicrobium sp.]